MEHFNKLSEAQQERLTMLFEDCSEVIHAVGKIMRHGYTSVDPTKRGDKRISNRQMLSHEIGQLEWMIKQMKSSSDLEEWAIRKAKEGRTDKAYKYIHHFKIS